jgi:hypothetical protein
MSEAVYHRVWWWRIHLVLLVSICSRRVTVQFAASAPGKHGSRNWVQNNVERGLQNLAIMRLPAMEKRST